MTVKKSSQKCEIMLVAGTRPEVIKLSELQNQLSFCNNVYVYTGQHFSENMRDIFFDELQSKADIDLACNTSDVEIIRQKLLKLILKIKPLVVIVYGDTNSTLAGALAANDAKTKIVHLEAGLRSFDLRMPEERNRIKIDQLSDYLLCPTTLSREFLRFEGIKDNVFVTGNLIVDVCKRFSKLEMLKEHPLTKDYILLTLHRAENVDDKTSLKILIKKLDEISKHKIIFPIHPRTKQNLKKNNIKIPKNVITVDPLGYVEFLSLLKHAKLVLTDSGGLQEEALILKKPCITLRYTTERWETILNGGNMLYPLLQNTESFEKTVDNMMKVKIESQPFGESVTKKTVIIIKKILEQCKKQNKIEL